MAKIAIRQGDITQAQTDAIVNAANPAMLGGGGVDGAIHRAAGPQLLEYCKAVEVADGVRCPIGEARITPAGKLKSKFVIHTVGPRYQVDPEPAKLLANAYHNSLSLALENGCLSVAFPAISCGVYGYPPEEAAKVSLSVCRQSQFQSLKMEFWLFGEALFRVWKQESETTPS